MPNIYGKLIVKAMNNDLCDDDLLSMNIRLIAIPLSYEIKGLTTAVGGWYQIAINARIPLDQQWNSLVHELAHIYLGHVSDDIKSVTQKEWEVDQLLETKNFCYVS